MTAEDEEQGSMQEPVASAASAPPEAWAEDQRAVADIYGRLDEMRAGYRQLLAQVRATGAAGSPQNRSERDAFATHYEDTIARLEQVEEGLIFGRLDMADGTTRYIGRIGISDEDHNSLLIDWRAPAAQPFYQATAVNRGEVQRRRHIATRKRHVVDVEDDLLDVEASDDLDELQGEGALFAAMARAREGRMSDIVATIQAEQDAIIRSELDGILVVDGGPGTGKTAVALHRAAYLLYTHRQRLARSGVLLIGPSRVFLRYIEQVLPSLGETGVVSTTLNSLLADVPVDGEEGEEVATLKGRVAMGKVLREAVRDLPRQLPEARVLQVDGQRLRLEPDDVTAAQQRARRTNRPHNVARKTYATALLDILLNRWAEQRDLDTEAERDYLLQSLRESPDVRREINLCWMPTSAQTLLRRLYADPQLLARYAAGLSQSELALLQRGPEASWTPADLPLLDELALLLGELEDPETERQRRARAAEHAAEVAYAEHAISEDNLGGGLVDAETLASRFAEQPERPAIAERALADREWTYGHLVVDEAQELSPMAWRALLRRNPSRSMTLVGDLDQRSGHRRVAGWSQLLGRAGSSQLRTAMLTINYRTPATIMTTAAQVLERAGGGRATPVRSARDVPQALRITHVDDAAQALPAVLRDELEALSEGRLALIAPANERDRLAERLAEELPGMQAAPGQDPLRAPLVVLDVRAAKGLEFDVVVLYEPTIVATSGPGDLYVAMTRPTKRLHVVAARGLPPGLSEG